MKLSKTEQLILNSLVVSEGKSCRFPSLITETFYIDTKGAELYKLIQRIELDIRLLSKEQYGDNIIPQVYKQYNIKSYKGLIKFLNTCRYLFMKLYPELAEEVH
jgi:hypothetical protein